MTYAHFYNFFTGSLTQPQGLQGILQEDEISKDPVSSSTLERCFYYSVGTEAQQLII